MSNVTKEQVMAGMQLVLVVADSVRELGNAPTGAIYAALSDRIDYAGFERIIGILVNTGVIRKNGNLLVWIEPQE